MNTVDAFRFSFLLSKSATIRRLAAETKLVRVFANKNPWRCETTDIDAAIDHLQETINHLHEAKETIAARSLRLAAPGPNGN